VRFTKQAKPLNLALQGGGAHGAFTWGVLDRLLEDPGLQFGWISGTSAGAINAVAVAAGLIENGPAGAREKLTAVWSAVAKSGVPDLMWYNPFLKGLAASAQPGAMMWSPYEFNPLGFDPLRKLLADHIDFEKIRTSSPVELLIAATDVSTGRARIFRNHEMTIDSVLASSCLPAVHHAVEINGVAYWDGGYSANPDLITLAAECPVADTLIIQITPLDKNGIPKSSKEITAQINQVTFNAPLLRDVELIEAIRETVGDAVFNRNDRSKRIAAHRFHLIDAGEHTSLLSDDSKMSPGAALLSRLHAGGRDMASSWLEKNRKAIGCTSTVDLKAHFLGDGSQQATVVEESPPQQPAQSKRRAAAPT
jgi:NTE family protein